MTLLKTDEWGPCTRVIGDKKCMVIQLSDIDGGDHDQALRRFYIHSFRPEYSDRGFMRIRFDIVHKDHSPVVCVDPGLRFAHKKFISRTGEVNVDILNQLVSKPIHRVPSAIDLLHRKVFEQVRMVSATWDPSPNTAAAMITHLPFTYRLLGMGSTFRFSSFTRHGVPWASVLVQAQHHVPDYSDIVSMLLLEHHWGQVLASHFIDIIFGRPDQIHDKSFLWDFKGADGENLNCVLIGRLLGMVDCFTDVGCGWGSYATYQLGVRQSDHGSLRNIFWNQVTSLDTYIVEDEDVYCKYGMRSDHKPTWHQELNHSAPVVHRWTNRKRAMYAPLSDDDRVFLLLARDCQIGRGKRRTEISEFATPPVNLTSANAPVEWRDACRTGGHVPFKGSLTVDDFVVARVQLRKVEKVFQRDVIDYDQWFFSLIASDLLVFDSALI
ncbi:hypothetical protein VKT23_012597 [Stygiomarasmius scandens]|uniref:Uncharacterized protein n=1 Tax=Marasmiellus scandens TaxID=2682957 RepID=A0ABR1J883_9AGAR